MIANSEFSERFVQIYFAEFAIAVDYQYHVRVGRYFGTEQADFLFVEQDRVIDFDIVIEFDSHWGFFWQIKLNKGASVYFGGDCDAGFCCFVEGKGDGRVGGGSTGESFVILKDIMLGYGEQYIDDAGACEVDDVGAVEGAVQIDEFVENGCCLDELQMHLFGFGGFHFYRTSRN